MATQTVRFNVDIQNLVIISGQFSVQGIVSGYAGTASFGSFSGTSFTANIPVNESGYFAVTVLVKDYTQDGVSHTVENHPLNLLATFYLPDLTDHSVVAVCPESSIASVYTFARMTTVNSDGVVSMNGTSRNMKIAYGMKQNLYLTEGGIAEMIRTSPNGLETNSYPMFNSLCNLLYYCLTNPILPTGEYFYDAFLNSVWEKQGTPNSSFLEAVRNLLYDPCTGAEKIYFLSASQPEVYKPSLVSMKVSDEKKIPGNWTLTLKSNKSGSKNFIPSGAAFVVFDLDDNAWVANNFRAGAGDSGTHCPVYKYDATPASFSPVQGGGLLGVAFGAAISPDKKRVSFGNFGWGSEYNNPQEGSISQFDYATGKPLSPPNGFTPGLSRVQGMEYDHAGNLWMASVGCQEPFAPAPVGVYPFQNEPSAVVVYLKSDSDPSFETTLICDEFPIKHRYEEEPVNKKTPYLKIFDVTPDHKGNAFVSCIGSYDKDPQKSALSAVYKVNMSNSKLTVIASWYSDFPNTVNKHKGFESLRQIAINGNGDVVVVGVDSSRATVLSGNDLSFKEYYETNTHAPWGVKIDRKQTVFLANFGHDKGSVKEGTLDLQAPFGVTMIRDTSKSQDAVLLTVPSGGDEVMLDNGYPLYGTQTRPVKPMVLVDGEPSFAKVQLKSYQPIMRLTSTNIDGAGNLWCMNNWKPSALVDVADNPGGDGVVIFLGIAEPE